MSAKATIGRTPIIVMSAYGERRNVEAGREAGADIYLVKPFPVEGLLDALAALLRLPA